MSDPELARPALDSAPRPVPPGDLRVVPPASRPVELRRRGVALWSSPWGRRGLVGAAVAVELAALAAVIVVGLDSSVDAVVRPASMTGTVHDVGVGGVNLRSAPQIATSTSRSIALDGTSLMIRCGVTGATVTGPAGASPLWFRTADDRYVSMLYVRVPGRAFVPSCGASADAPLVPVLDPAAPPAPQVPASGDAMTAAVPGAAGTGARAGSTGSGVGGRAGGGGRGGTAAGPRVAPVVPGAPASRAPAPATPTAQNGGQDNGDQNNGDQNNGGQDNGDQNNGGQNNGGQNNGDQPQG